MARAVVGEGLRIKSDRAAQRTRTNNADRARSAAIDEPRRGQFYGQVERQRGAARLCFETVDRNDRRLPSNLGDRRPGNYWLWPRRLSGMGPRPWERKSNSDGRANEQHREDHTWSPSLTQRIFDTGNPVSPARS